MKQSFPHATVIKLGGSLFDLPDLGHRLRGWLATLDTRAVLLVPGGGATADVVRDLDRCHRLGEEAAHWLALRALTLNAHFLTTLLPESRVVSGWEPCPPLWEQNLLPILDAHAFLAADDAAGALPHCWDVTSDSIAARVAAVGGARRLVLLKSADIPDALSWSDAAERGLVDPYLAKTLPGDCNVRAVNLRDGRVADSFLSYHTHSRIK